MFFIKIHCTQTFNQPNYPISNPMDQNFNPFLNYEKDSSTTNIILSILGLIPLIGVTISAIACIVKLVNLKKELKKYIKVSAYFAKKMQIVPFNISDEDFEENFIKNPQLYLQSYQYGNFKKMPDNGNFKLFLYSFLIIYILQIVICGILKLMKIIELSKMSKNGIYEYLIKNGILKYLKKNIKQLKYFYTYGYILTFFIIMVIIEALQISLVTYKIITKTNKLMNIKEKFGNLMELSNAQNEINQFGFYGKTLNTVTDFYYKTYFNK